MVGWLLGVFGGWLICLGCVFLFFVWGLSSRKVARKLGILLGGKEEFVHSTKQWSGPTAKLYCKPFGQK